MDTNLDRAGQQLSNGRVPNHLAYRAARLGVTKLIADGTVPADLTIPSCPEWTVRDLVAHLVGISSLAIGRMSGWVKPERSSADTDVAGLVAEWGRMGEHAEYLIEEHGGRRGSLMVLDAFTHELDLRYALGAPLPDEHPAFPRAFEVVLSGFSAEVAAHDLPAILVEVDGHEWQAGIGEPVATLSGARYDIYRSLVGRRTHEQITRLGWSRESHRWLPAFTWGPFTPPTRPVEDLVRA